MDSSSDNNTPLSKVKCKRKVRIQKYLENWENDPKFEGWLTKSMKGPEYFHCKACNADGNDGKSELEEHADGKKK